VSMVNEGMDGRAMNASVVQRFVDEVFNGGNMRIIRDLVAPDHVSHLPNGDHYGPDGVRIDVEDFRRGFPDIHLTLDEVLTTEDRVVYRFTAVGTHEGPFMGLAATGRKVRVAGIAMDRLHEGRTVERWVQFDSAGLLAQLGSLPWATLPA
jgi:steroid delta-isomerase-like uncharacterized protein